MPVVAHQGELRQALSKGHVGSHEGLSLPVINVPLITALPAQPHQGLWRGQLGWSLPEPTGPGKKRCCASVPQSWILKHSANGQAVSSPHGDPQNASSILWKLQEWIDLQTLWTQGSAQASI